MSAIPSVDLKDFVSGDQIRKQKFINEIGSAFENIGFVALKSHFLSDELVAKLYQEIKLFFELPQNIKDNMRFLDFRVKEATPLLVKSMLKEKKKAI